MILSYLKNVWDIVMAVKVTDAIYHWVNDVNIAIPLDDDDIVNIPDTYYTYNTGLGYYQMTYMDAFRCAIAFAIAEEAEDTADLNDDWETPSQYVLRIPFGPAFDLTGTVTELQRLLNFIHEITSNWPSFAKNIYDTIVAFNFDLPGSSTWQYWDYTTRQLKYGFSFEPIKTTDFDDLVYMLALIRFTRFVAKHIKPIGRFGQKVVSNLYKLILGVLKAPGKYVSSRMRRSRLVESITSSTAGDLEAEFDELDEGLAYVVNKFKGAYSPQKGSVYF